MFAITHQLSAGHNFDGQVPGSTPVTEHGVKVYPEDTVTNHAGLFEFGSGTRAIRLIGIQIKFGGQNTWDINVVDPSGVEFDLANGTTETSYFRSDTDAITLLPGQKLKLVTVGVIASAMRATVLFAPAQLGET